MIFEVCCGCTEDAVNAAAGGADRIELNSALFLGGLTPSLGSLIEVKKAVSIPIMAMVRPREGGFCYSDFDFNTILRDAEILLSEGADGLVFGFLNPNGTVDVKRTEKLTELCLKNDKEAVFSRAADVTPDIFEAVSILESIGVNRVLTSGAKPSAIEGKDVIKELKLCSHSIEILPGGGLRAGNVSDFVEFTGVNQVHASARSLRYDTSVNFNKEIYFGGSLGGAFLPENEYKVTDVSLVREMKKIIDNIRS